MKQGIPEHLHKFKKYKTVLHVGFVFVYNKNKNTWNKRSHVKFTLSFTFNFLQWDNGYMDVRNIILHVSCYSRFFSKLNKKLFDISKHESNKTAIKQLVAEKIKEHKTSEEKNMSQL